MNKYNAEIFERKRIEELQTRLSSIYKSMKNERRKVWDKEKSSRENYTVWDRLEILSMDIEGYASQISSRGYIRQTTLKVLALPIFLIDKSFRFIQ